LNKALFDLEKTRLGIPDIFSRDIKGELKILSKDLRDEYEVLVNRVYKKWFPNGTLVTTNTGSIPDDILEILIDEELVDVDVSEYMYGIRVSNETLYTKEGHPLLFWDEQDAEIEISSLQDTFPDTEYEVVRFKVQFTEVGDR
jgi:hypothetical protein